MTYDTLLGSNAVLAVVLTLVRNLGLLSFVKMAALATSNHENPALWPSTSSLMKWERQPNADCLTTVQTEYES